MKLNLYVVFFLVFALACSNGLEKVVPDNVLTFGTNPNITKLGLYSCNIPFSVDIANASPSVPYKGWIVSVINDFNNKDTYLKFEENSSPNIYSKLNVQFLPKENFQNTNSEGVFSFSNYAITRIDSSYISLNSDFDWTEGLIKKAVAFHLGQMLDLAYNGSDEESVMNPDLTQTYKGLSTNDIQNFQSKFSSTLLSGSITKGSVSARSVSLSWNLSNPQGRYIKGSGLCWSDTSSNPTISNQGNFYAGVSSGSWATGWNRPGRTFYFRSYFMTDCEIIYSPVLKLIVPQSNTWEAGDTAPFSSRTGAAVVATDGIFGKAFIIGGKLSSNNELTNEVWLHQPGL